MRMTERQQILILVAITLLVGVLAVAGATALPGLFQGNLDVQHYDAVFFENGTLVERYTYDVHAAGEYRMLFRYWDAPLTFAAIDRPHIEFLGMTAPPGTVGYVKDSGVPALLIFLVVGIRPGPSATSRTPGAKSGRPPGPRARKTSRLSGISRSRTR